MNRVLLAILGLALLASYAYTQPFNSGPSTGINYPAGSQPISCSATGTTAATSCTLTGTPGTITIVCGFVLTSGGTTAAVVGNATITNAIGGTLNFAYVSVSSGQGVLGGTFPQCIPANAPNTSMVVQEPAGGTGSVTAVAAWGYRLPI